MKLFLSGSFRELEDILRDAYRLLSEKHEVWWAHVNIERGYGSKDKEKQTRIVEIEKKEVENSDEVVAIVRETTPGTFGEIVHGHDHDVPITTYLLPLNSVWHKFLRIFGKIRYSNDFESVWFPYHAGRMVYTRGEKDLLQKLREI